MKQKQIQFAGQLVVVKANHKIVNVELNPEVELEQALGLGLEQEQVLEPEQGLLNNIQDLDQLLLPFLMEAGVRGVITLTVLGAHTAITAHIAIVLGVDGVDGVHALVEAITL